MEHPGVEVRFTPKHASWVNPIESVFGILARQVLKHGWFATVNDCALAVQAWGHERSRTGRAVRSTWQTAA